MRYDEFKTLKRGDILLDKERNEWIVADFTHFGGETVPTVVRTMTITYSAPWTKKETI